MGNTISKGFCCGDNRTARNEGGVVTVNRDEYELARRDDRRNNAAPAPRQRFPVSSTVEARRILANNRAVERAIQRGDLDGLPARFEAFGDLQPKAYKEAFRHLIRADPFNNGAIGWIMNSRAMTIFTEAQRAETMGLMLDRVNVTASLMMWANERGQTLEECVRNIAPNFADELIQRAANARQNARLAMFNRVLQQEYTV